MQKVFMRFNSIPAGEFEKAIKWFSDTYLKESYEKPPFFAPGFCTAIRTAPDRYSSRAKWWWTSEDMLENLEDFEEVFYNSLGEL